MIYISSGELISGGRQDRMVTRDTLLGTEWTGISIFQSCVWKNSGGVKRKKNSPMRILPIPICER